MKFMVVTAMLVLMAGPAVAADQTEILSDYGQALNQTRSTGKKPLLVILENEGSEKKVEQVSHNDSLGLSSNLLDDYTVCRVDVGSEYGQAVAKSFKATSFPHTVVIDRHGKYQVFKKTGEFTSPEWNSMLVKYSKPEPAAQPVQYYYNYSCPSCRR